MGEGTRSSSTPDSIARALRHDLLAGDLAPGTRLTEEALSARFGCGRHSVRAGLQALVAEGLLEHQRNKGIVVPAVTAERIDDMCSYRSVLELGALRLALARGSDFEQVAAAVDRLSALDDDAPWRLVAQAHSEVHTEIVAAAGNGRLLAAHRACQNELNCMLATIRSDFPASRVALMHRHLLDRLRVGGEAAMRALEDDLELGGRAAMHLALRRRSGIPAHIR
ncbi:GntR family transcriptional regulator [Nocardia cyriacigeorgica]|uniref:GntR family transcriptional regulator n=1 Tax=Nocardia cyriacigeorgica TaxID=135487 RepID=UPI001032AE27|nr:GntR family transcriptional regulator [Nocardia cyriacigeorgica]MBF6101179.1 GntR family transcriptional regulator [Nocardia cyriacigeorgica]MBF6320059.1 GntR family transcriptional regulator [Nocardia cyriacigeorgica]MBF6517081.1 GntR family transcriptional regulator [Nocardia cyriacigeorgica]MBF6534477.1 GntR family transcriptional regulator [Nocardia cyriacigeorgica]